MITGQFILNPDTCAMKKTLSLPPHPNSLQLS